MGGEGTAFCEKTSNPLQAFCLSLSGAEEGKEEEVQQGKRENAVFSI